MINFENMMRWSVTLNSNFLFTFFTATTKAWWEKADIYRKLEIVNTKYTFALLTGEFGTELLK